MKLVVISLELGWGNGARESQTRPVREEERAFSTFHVARPRHKRNLLLCATGSEAVPVSESFT